MDEPAVDTSPRTRLPGSWIGWAMAAYALGSVVLVVTALVRQDWSEVARSTGMAVLWAWGSALWLWPRDLPRWAPVVAFAGATVWIVLGLAELL